MGISSTCSPWMNVDCIGRAHPTSQAISPLHALRRHPRPHLSSQDSLVLQSPPPCSQIKNLDPVRENRGKPPVFRWHKTPRIHALLLCSIMFHWNNRRKMEFIWVHYILPTSLCSPSSSPQFQVTHPMAPPAGSRPARCHRRTSQPHPGAVAEGWPSHGCPTERPTRKAMAEVRE